MTGLCPNCRQWFAVKGGRIRQHEDLRGNRCWGTNGKPEEREIA